MAELGKGPYDDLYARFVILRGKAKGYEFQHAPMGNVPPPSVSFAQPLRWWTWNRWRRRQEIRAARDRRVQEILEIRAAPPSKA